MRSAVPRGAASFCIMSFFSTIARKASTTPLARLAAIGALAACVPPATLANVVATAASTLFEAAPLLLIAASLGPALPGGLRHWPVALLGCGCGKLPGALSLPATALCWFSFGPAVALGRWSAAFSGVALFRRHGVSNEHEPRVFEQLTAVAGFSLLGALMSAALRSAMFGDVLAAAPAPALFLIGVTTGMLAPCTLGSIAFAASVHATMPALAGGVLWSTGLFALPLPRAQHDPQTPVERGIAARPLYAAMALACAGVAVRGGAALVHPKLAPWVALGALVAARRALFTRARVPPATAIAVLAMLGTAVSANTSARENAPATAFDALVVGERVHLSAQLAGQTRATLVRYAITCCRADAAPIAVRLDRTLSFRSGTWVAVDGTVVADAGGALVHVLRVRLISAPPDPFLYR
jgi:hypothetical protein